jgi:hypothetical protein
MHQNCLCQHTFFVRLGRRRPHFELTIQVQTRVKNSSKIVALGTNLGTFLVDIDWAVRKERDSVSSVSRLVVGWTLVG